MQSVQIKLVLGHSASWRKRPTAEGYTHDWTVLVRGEDGQDIHDVRHFVEKVVFYLHESFPKPRRGMIGAIRVVDFSTFCLSMVHMWLLY